MTLLLSKFPRSESPSLRSIALAEMSLLTHRPREATHPHCERSRSRRPKNPIPHLKPLFRRPALKQSEEIDLGREPHETSLEDPVWLS